MRVCEGEGVRVTLSCFTGLQTGLTGGLGGAGFGTTGLAGIGGAKPGLGTGGLGLGIGTGINTLGGQCIYHPLCV